jgi:Family of unknown function (DUF6338)
VFPDTIGAVFGVLLAISPGLVYEFIRERRRPTADRSAFREAAWVAAASVAFSTAALILVLLAQIAVPDLLADPSQWLALGGSYATGHVAQVIAFVVSWTALGCGLAALTAFKVIKKTADIDPNTTAWFHVFRKRSPPDRDRSIRVQLRDGDEYIGRLVYYDAHILYADREIVLGPPLHRRASSAERFDPLPPDEGWERVVIPATSIDVMWIRYPPRIDGP